MQSWTPADFILYGKLCDDLTLGHQVEKIRQALHAEATILLVSRGSRFFRSLIHVADSNTSRATSLRFELIQHCNENLNEETRELPSQPYSGTLEKARYLFPQSAVYSGLVQQFGESTRLEMFPKHACDSNKLLPKEERPASLMVVALNATDADSSAAIELIKQLACMVNASQAVRAHRWNYSAREVDRLLDDCEKLWETELEKTGPSGQPGNDFERVLRYSGELLLELAAKLTRSSIGQVFLAQSDARKLMVLAWKQYPCEIYTLEGIVSLAYSRVRAVLINDIQAFEDSHPGIKYLMPKGADSGSRAELAIPITQNTASDDQAVIGVLNVEKAASDPGDYTTRDLDVCQHLARRFCRWRARIQHTIFARSLAQLTRKVALTSNSAKRRPMTAQEANHESHGGTRGHIHWVSEDEWYDDRIPSEFRRALQPVEEALKTAFELTRSHMVRVFLVTADASALVPFCDWPLKAFHNTEPTRPATFAVNNSVGHDYDECRDAHGKRIILPVISLDRHARSISAWVARNGKACFVGNFDDPNALNGHNGLESYLRTYDDTRSECCVPLFITGRLIGTLNFQSYYINVYREQRHLIEAIAELIGLTFAHARRAVEQEILENRAVLAYQRHELIHEVEVLETMANQRSSPPEFREKITSVKEALNLARFPIEAFDGLAGLPDRTILALVEKQIERVQKRPIFETNVRSFEVCAEDEVPEDAVFPLMVAVQEVLHNAQQEASIAQGKVRIDCEKRLLGGQAYAVIRVRNPCNDKGPASYQYELYRQPFRKEQNERPHLGAFIAGSLLRAFGGELSFEWRRSPDSRGFFAITQVEVILKPRGKHGSVFRSSCRE